MFRYDFANKDPFFCIIFELYFATCTGCSKPNTDMLHGMDQVRRFHTKFNVVIKSFIPHLVSGMAKAFLHIITKI